MSLSLLKQRSLKELFNLVFNALRDVQTFEQSRNILLDIQVDVRTGEKQERYSTTPKDQLLPDIPADSISFEKAGEAREGVAVDQHAGENQKGSAYY